MKKTTQPLLTAFYQGGKFVLSTLQELADMLEVTLACSRPIVEAGLMPYERQVGQTGKTVAPKLYIVVGVSGSVSTTKDVSNAAPAASDAHI